MCGIAGVVNFEKKEVHPETIKRMTDVIMHRGPDDAGLFIDGNVGLGHRRLSIIDLSEKGHQPMCNEDGTVWIVFNGEIYNYKELNQNLLAKGHKIKSNCDTETVIHLYEENGAECVQYLRGMFSFAIWDSKKKVLFAAVDRLRIKPFYYSLSNDNFVFASELKAIQASNLVKSDLNFEAIHHYFSLQAVPVPMTIFKNIYTLPGGYCLELKDGKADVRQYWDIPLVDQNGGGYSEEYYKKQLYDLFYESVEVRMMSDVPLGAFLSGGIDSSIIVGLMKDMQRGPVKTFSIGYDVGGSDWDDTYYADLVSKKYKTDHTVQTITASDILNNLKNFIWYLDQPSTDAINSYFVSKLAARDVTVVLCGQGGDELFSGYRTFDLMRLFMNRDRKWEQLPAPIRSMASKIFFAIPESIRSFPVGQKFGKFFHNYGSFVNKFATLRMEMNEGDKNRIYSKFFKQELNGSNTHQIYNQYYRRVADHPDMNDIISYLELKMHLGDILMRDVDVMSMAFSLETRIPLIDQKLVELVATIPSDMKIKTGIKKYILIETMKKVLPEEVRSRKKRGFAFPFNIWLRDQLKPLVEFVLSEENINNRGFFNYSEVRRLKENFYTNNRLAYRKVWGLIILELWMRRTLENDKEYFQKLYSFVASTLK